MASQNAVVGDDSFGTKIPETQVQDDQLDAEVRMAAFTKSTGYEELKAFVQAKIDYYQKCLPGDVPPENIPEEERGKYWAVATIVIREFQGILNAYEDANTVVSEANKRA